MYALNQLKPATSLKESTGHVFYVNPAATATGNVHLSPRPGEPASRTVVLTNHRE